MEFFKSINIQTTGDQIQKKIRFDNLDNLCESMFVMDYSNNIANIGSIWGEFSLQKDNINGGLRFSLLECPNALVFTITTGSVPDFNKMNFHLTVNKQKLEALFVEEIEDFIDDWKTGIESNFEQ